MPMQVDKAQATENMEAARPSLKEAEAALQTINLSSPPTSPACAKVDQAPSPTSTSWIPVCSSFSAGTYLQKQILLPFTVERNQMMKQKRRKQQLYKIRKSEKI